ncbi:MAG: diguanylate cyclase [Deltaproteobacteria bacterium]|nr:diguanylate cyclase [Deltaproteobacteria bacterium]
MPERNREKALIVHNGHPSFLSLLESQLVSAGFDVHVITESDKGLRFFRDNLPALVVLDSRLQPIPWETFCQNIRHHPEGRYVTILLTSPSPEPELLKTAIDHGVNHLLDPEENPQALEAWILWARKMVEYQADLKHSCVKLEAIEKEMSSLNIQLETSLSRANKMAVEAELAYLELDQIFKNAAGGILVVNTSAKVLRYNEAFLKTTRLDRREMEGKKCFEVFKLPLCHTPQCPLNHIRKGKKRVEQEVEWRSPDGIILYFLLVSTPLRGPDGDLIAMVTNVTDITGRVTAEQALRKSEEQFRLVVEKAPFGQTIVGKDRKVEYVNPKFSEIFGYSLEELPDEKTWLKGAYCPRSIDTADRGIPDQSGEREKADQEGERIFKAVCKDNCEKIVTIEEVDLGDERKVVTYVDVTDRIRAEEALRESQRRYRELSIIDDLTGLFNKRHFNHTLNNEINRARRYKHPLSLILMDIDDFKHFNDTYGHPKGDQVLSTMGKIIQENIRQSDSGFRYGGEEFVVIMPDTDGNGAVVLAERIREKFASIPFQPTRDQTVRKTVSIGVAEYLGDEEAKEFLARADENMYRAKKTGKNRVIFS